MEPLIINSQIVITRSPNPSGFLRDLFNPQNQQLFPIFARITQLASEQNQVDFWRNELVNSSRTDLFTQDGWNYTLQQLDLVVSFTQQEKGILNAALAAHYLTEVF